MLNYFIIDCVRKKIELWMETLIATENIIQCANLYLDKCQTGWNCPCQNK